jgi:hypothetical protein
MNNFEKSEKHIVIFKGENKLKWYDVESISGKEYQVNLFYSCTCKYFSVHQKPCSHIIAVIKQDLHKEQEVDEDD